MDKKNCLIVIAVAVVSFALGFMVKFMISVPNVKDVQENEIVIIENENVEVMVRIREGYVEWHDGTTWNRARSVEELQTEDIYNLAQDDLESFEESYRMMLDMENEALIEVQNEIMSEPLVGSDKKPITTTTTSVVTGTDNTAETVVANVPGQSEGTTSSGSAGTTTTPSTPSAPANPGTTTTPSDSENTTPPSTPSTGDGEDIGWSDDYL